LSLPVATSIGNSAFSDTGQQALTITLGSTRPTFGTSLFLNAGGKPVTLKVPYIQADGADGWEAAGYYIGMFYTPSVNLTIESSL
jgi:hypothetical protein